MRHFARTRTRAVAKTQPTANALFPLHEEAAAAIHQLQQLAIARRGLRDEQKGAETHRLFVCRDFSCQFHTRSRARWNVRALKPGPSIRTGSR